MGRTYSEIDDKLAKFIDAQHMFFVATAPRSDGGHVNLSPKGLDAFRILDKRTVAYLEVAGSGIETVAHLRENGRICIMFCAFEGGPNIVRLYGRGKAIEKGDREFDLLRPEFPEMAGVRSIVKVDVDRVSDSCGFGVPLYDYKGQRDTMHRYVEKVGIETVEENMRTGNRESIDGLPGLRFPSDAV